MDWYRDSVVNAAAYSHRNEMTCGRYGLSKLWNDLICYAHTIFVYIYTYIYALCECYRYGQSFRNGYSFAVRANVVKT